MGQEPIRTTVQAVFFGRRKIYPQQFIHCAVAEPLPVHPELAAGIDEWIHHQQLKRLRLRNILTTRWQTLLPETGQPQLLPEPTRQPAVPERGRTSKFHRR